jgi:hypothetical protein
VSNLAGALSSGRQFAESLMTDACTVKRVTGRTFDESTGEHVDTLTTLYTGACRVQMRGAARLADAGDTLAVIGQVVVSVPITSVGYAVGDLVTITSATYDSTLVGTTYRVREPFAKSQATARRLVCEELP